MESIELRHTRREKVQMSLALAALFPVFTMGDLWARGVSPWIIAPPTALVGLLTYGMMSLEFTRADAEGFSHRRLFFTYRIRWDEVEAVEADWSPGFQGLASSYGANAIAGFLRFEGRNGKTLGRFRIAHGPVDERLRLRDALVGRLGGRVLDKPAGQGLRLLP